MNTAIQSLTTKEIMTPKPICAKPTDLVKVVQDYFSKYQISSLPVVNEKGHLLGILSASDIARSKNILDMKELFELMFQDSAIEAENIQEFFHLDAHEEAIVQDIMDPNPLTAALDDSVELLTKKMIESRQHRAVILNPAQQVVGIISSLDILKVAIS